MIVGLGHAYYNLPRDTCFRDQDMEIDSEPISATVGISNLDEDLMERLRSITTSNHEDLIAQFRTTTNAVLTDEGCIFFLEMNNWNLNEAILAYYDAEMPTDKVPQVRFIADVTVGEGEAIPPSTRFIKTWRVENSGQEAWPRNCSLRFVNGDRLQDRDEIYVGSLRPNEQINISAEITSPAIPRIIKSQWRLFTSAGVPFGDPIWLIASVEVGGLMGITQQMDQCHSLGLNMPHPHNCSQYLASQISGQSPHHHNLQSNRWPRADTQLPVGAEWSNYPLMPVHDYSLLSSVNHPSADPPGSAGAMMDDGSLDAF